MRVTVRMRVRVRVRGVHALIVTLTQVFSGAELSMRLPVSTFWTSATWDLPIPYIGSLVGQSLYQQAFVIDPGANPLGAVVSNAGTARIGF